MTKADLATSASRPLWLVQCGDAHDDPMDEQTWVQPDFLRLTRRPLRNDDGNGSMTEIACGKSYVESQKLLRGLWVLQSAPLRFLRLCFGRKLGNVDAPSVEGHAAHAVPVMTDEPTYFDQPMLFFLIRAGSKLVSQNGWAAFIWNQNKK